MKTKKCSNKDCDNPVKPISEFYKDKNRTDGLNPYCKQCNKEYKKIRYKLNREKLLIQAKEYRDNNKEKIYQLNKKYRINNQKQVEAYQKEYRDDNKEKISKNKKEYYEDNKEEIAIKGKKYRDNNKEKIRKRDKKYQKDNKKKISKKDCKYKKERRKTDINFKLKCNLRKRIWDVVKGNSKSKSTKKLLGCSIEFLKNHLESQFQEGMNWANYGKWHVDHIKPCVKFDLSKPDQQRLCFNYKNLQPLWAIDNLRKNKF